MRRLIFPTAAFAGVMTALIATTSTAHTGCQLSGEMFQLSNSTSHAELYISDLPQGRGCTISFSAGGRSIFESLTALEAPKKARISRLNVLKLMYTPLPGVKGDLA